MIAGGRCAPHRLSVEPELAYIARSRLSRAGWGGRRNGDRPAVVHALQGPPALPYSGIALPAMLCFWNMVPAPVWFQRTDGAK